MQSEFSPRMICRLSPVHIVSGRNPAYSYYNWQLQARINARVGTDPRCGNRVLRMHQFPFLLLRRFCGGRHMIDPHLELIHPLFRCACAVIHQVPQRPGTLVNAFGQNS